ncbi:MAG: rod shape-determining protein MreD [Pseudomonadota bacterium]
MKAFLFILFGGILVVIVQTAVVGIVVPPAYKPDIMLILVVWVSLRPSMIGGIAFAFAGGILVDLFSGSPTGLFALVYCLIFVASGSANSTFEMNRPIARALVVFASAMGSGGAVVLARWLAGPIDAGIHTPTVILEKSVITALASFIVFPILDGSWAGYAKQVGER